VRHQTRFSSAFWSAFNRSLSPGSQIPGYLERRETRDVKLTIRVSKYPGPAIATLAFIAIGTRAAIPTGMQQLALTAGQVALIDEATAPAAAPLDDAALMAMPLTEAKRLAAAEFERRYLVAVMERAAGSVSEGARLSGLDRTNFRRLLHRHGLR
jgi:DNA-binding NtrC family response regulator